MTTSLVYVLLALVELVTEQILQKHMFGRRKTGKLSATLSSVVTNICLITIYRLLRKKLWIKLNTFTVVLLTEDPSIYLYSQWKKYNIRLFNIVLWIEILCRRK